MALTQSFVKFNIVGARKEDYILATFTGVTEGIINTRLHWVEAVSIEDVVGADATVSTYPNSTTASDIEDDPGQIFITGSTAEEIYNIRVIGR